MRPIRPSWIPPTRWVRFHEHRWVNSRERLGFGGDPEETHRAHNRLLHFLGKADWSDRAVRREAARYTIDELSKREDVSVWIVDDTGFLKQGKHSVGVQRQYTGSAGKTANCQIGVSLAVATPTQQLPIDFDLYLPRSWTSDPTRRKKVRIPEGLAFRTKPEIALDMIGDALDDGIPGEIVLADSAYGDSSEFRAGLRFLGMDYAVAIKRSTTVFLIDRHGTASEAAVSCEAVSRQPNVRFRRLSWRHGTKGKLSSSFAFLRVKAAHDDGLPLADRPVEWLVIERDDEGNFKYILTTLRQSMTKKAIVKLLKKRWRTERMYQELKGELGLDHFEGRSYPGWHHHVSVVVACYAFVVAERARSFFPSATGTSASASHRLKARASLCRFLQDNQTRPRKRNRSLAPKVPRVSSAERFERVLSQLTHTE